MLALSRVVAYNIPQEQTEVTMTMLRGWITTRNLFLAGSIILLAGLVISGLYLVRERGEAVRREVAVQQAEEQLREDSNPDEVATNADEKDDNVGTEAGAGSEAEPSVEELPETGPTQNLIGLVVIALLAYALSSYVLSRRALVEARQNGNR